MKRLLIFITLPWGDDDAMSEIARKIEPHLRDNKFMLDFLSRCPDMNMTMGEHSTPNKET